MESLLVFPEMSGNT